MARVDRSTAGSGESYPKHKLTADMIPGDTCVLTIAQARQVQHKDQTVNKGAFFVIEFDEFPDTGYYTNATQEDALLALLDASILSADMDDWRGDKLPMFKRENKNPESGQIVAKLYVCTPDEYVEACKTWGKKGAPKKLVKYDPATAFGGSGTRGARKPVKRGK